MSRLKVLAEIEETGIIAVIRLTDASNVNAIINALSSGGIKAMEITMTTPGATEIIAQLAKELEDEFIVGAGTVMDAITAREVIEAGARFVVSPIFDSEMVTTAHDLDCPVFPGAYSPTEIWNAWQGGADVVKVFPATILGPGYFKDIHGPLPQVKLTPTGGVSLQNARAFIEAGACFLGVGGALLDKQLIAQSDWDELATLARKYSDEIAAGRKKCVAVT